MESQVIDKFTIARGSAGPKSGDAVEAQRADDLARDLQGNAFYTEADGVLFVRCIDERLREFIRQVDGLRMAPNSAGGTMSLVVMDILTGGRITGTGTIAQRYIRMVDYLIERGLPVGGHFDEHDHSQDDGSGCGACDKLGVIFAYMLEMLDDLCAFARKLGVEIDTDMVASIRRELQAVPEFSKGAEILGYLKGLPDGTVVIENMLGLHDALAVMLNFEFGTTLDREALATTGRSAFNFDAWAVEPSAVLVYGKDDERQIKFAVAAVVLYNLATGGVLCNDEMRIGIRR